MRYGTARLAALAALALAAGCAAAPDTAGEAPAAGAAALALPAPGSPAPETAAEAAPAPGAEVPHVYMALQPGGPGHPHSVVFAIDAARDGTPGDDPAVRLTPEAGRCNPQEMRRYDFSGEAEGPVVSEDEGASGLTARDLPAFLAATVTGRLLEAGLASEPEDTRPLNVCTRKLWERLVVAENRAAGQ